MTNINLPTYEQVEDIRQQFPINSGTDFLNGTQVLSQTTTSHQATKLAEISGEGILIGITTNSGIFTYQCDDGPIYSNTSGGTFPFTIFAPFKNNLKVYGSSPAHVVSYILL